jgi:rhodanese-related sulfurtransferase
VTSLGIDALLDRARATLYRVTPAQAAAAMLEGAILVDIRPVSQRAQYGEVPGALIIERNHLEWRLDPACEARLPLANSYDLVILVLCQEGYSSSLAAATLREIGLHRATDVIGGYLAWQAAGLPTTADPALLTALWNPAKRGRPAQAGSPPPPLPARPACA